MAAERALAAINPDIEVRGVVDDLRPGTAEDLLAGADVVCDGTDNFETRYLINDWAVRERVPWVYAGVVGTGGLVLPVVPGETACLACVFETPPEPGAAECETAGVLGPAVAVVAAIQTAETMKLLVGARDRLLGGSCVTKHGRARSRLSRPAARARGARHAMRADFAWLEGAPRLPGRAPLRAQRDPNPAGRATRARPDRGGPEDRGGMGRRGERALLRARRDGVTVNLFRDGRAIVDGTADEAEARSILARVVGT